MLAGVSFVNRPQTPHVNAPVHDEPMHAPLDEIAGEEHWNHKQPLPSRANEMLRAVVDRCDAHSIQHADVQKTVVCRVYVRLVVFPKLALPFRHHDRPPFEPLICQLSVSRIQDPCFAGKDEPWMPLNKRPTAALQMSPAMAALRTEGRKRPMPTPL